MHLGTVGAGHFHSCLPGCPETLHVSLNAGWCLLIGFRTKEEKRKSHWVTPSSQATDGSNHARRVRCNYTPEIFPRSLEAAKSGNVRRSEGPLRTTNVRSRAGADCRSSVHKQMLRSVDWDRRSRIARNWGNRPGCDRNRDRHHRKNDPPA
jgi:hypothetical protein